MILYCDNCNAFVNTEKIASYTSEEQIDENYETFLENDGIPYKNVMTVEYVFSKCLKCSDPFLIKSDGGFRVDLIDDSGTETLYPISKIDLGYDVPNPISEAYNEALICFKNRASTASIIMCRKVIQGICKVHNIDKGNLREDLNLMKQNEIIDETLFKWAEALRFFGNSAAHDIYITFSREDALDTINFTHAIIEYIFTYQKKIKDFMKRRTKKKET